MRFYFPNMATLTQTSHPTGLLQCGADMPPPSVMPVNSPLESGQACDQVQVILCDFQDWL